MMLRTAQLSSFTVSGMLKINLILWFIIVSTVVCLRDTA
jgi:hypothetical protein